MSPRLWGRSLLLMTICVTSFGAATLQDAFRSALNHDESPAIAKTQLEGAQSHVSSLRGHLFPNISFVGNYQRQDVPDGGATSAVAQPDQSSARFTATQPIFHGFRDFAELSSASWDRDAAQAQAEGTELKLYDSVATQFFRVLSARKDVENLKALQELTATRIKDLEQRTKVGRSRKGELLAAKAQAASILADIAAADSEKLQAEASLRDLTGWATVDELTDGDEPVDIPTRETAMMASESRASVRALKAQEESANAKVRSAWGAHAPSLDLVGNYYLKRTGFLDNIKWDVGLQLTVPIFSGGTIHADVREATAKRKERSLGLAQGIAQARLETENLWNRLERLNEQHRLLKEALELARLNYEEQTRDYRYGLVTNLDVLSALNTFQESKRNFDKAHFQLHATFASLSVAMGKKPGG